MRSGICPKCAATEVFASTPSVLQGRISITLGHVAVLETLVCAACGYAESYVTQPKDRQKIRDLWDRVRVRRPE